MSAACAPLPLRSIRHILHRHLAPRIAHLLDVLERDLRAERLALPRLGDNAVELVDLLERQTLGLVDHEVDEGDADEAAGAPAALLAGVAVRSGDVGEFCLPNEEHLGLEIAGILVDHVRGSVRDGEVQEPVGGGRDRQALGTDLQREDLTGDDPSDRTL